VKHKLFQILLSAASITLFITVGAVMSAAQSPASQDASTDAAQTRSNADETFELNISERRITEQNFNASTSVEAGEESARGLRLRIGVGVGAEQIDVLLRNVHGSVRFRGTLDRVLELINSRRAPETTP